MLQYVNAGIMLTNYWREYNPTPSPPTPLSIIDMNPSGSQCCGSMHLSRVHVPECAYESRRRWWTLGRERRWSIV